ncbi:MULTISPECIES: YeaC family protein [unclassified Photobacterium]|uniref:YeaC family protein n=1 Tax=unclassified Photobacterium TaxID=2628852 RepID=UPI001B8AC90D|nr:MULTISPECIES: DUF1315 family protein [unclassified Photobacterium]MDO6707104.1 DUF1315 family protein [Photobacterium sp. 1_MG-2023]QUJ68276.1 DUF1315 family protein [Photobacterium sp. GJ3]
MDVQQILAAMTPEVYQRLLAAVETGKWADGTPLTEAQRESTLQAVMLYQSRHNTDAEHMSVAAGGDIRFKSKAELKRDFAIEDEAPVADIARFPLQGN